jgi:L-2-hydroxyglutarate oxidase
MMHSKKHFDIAIVGGGIVGLASAWQLLQQKPNLRVAVIEKEAQLAAHQTGHNSGVIHSGIYYKPGSLKAQNCLRGYAMMIEFCKTYGIAFDKCGKLIVAVDETELTELEKLYNRGHENGLTEIKYVAQNQIAEYEPHLNGVRAIHVPYTGIIDYTEVCMKLAELVQQAGGEIFTGNAVEAVTERDGQVYITTQIQTLSAKMMINCAGLYCDKIAQLAGEQSDTRIIPFRGEYYMLREDKRHLVKNLIYPVPDPNFPFLGVHFTRMIDGSVEAGPNAVFAFKREGYYKEDVDVQELFESITWPGFQKVALKYWKTGMGEFYRSFSKAAFTKALQRLIPEVQEDDLISAEAGVRAQACDRTGGLIDDFKIIERERFVHILNAPSPAATSSLSIGATIAELTLKRFN